MNTAAVQNLIKTMTLNRPILKNSLIGDELFPPTEYRADPETFDVDPLVLSVRLKKILKENPNRWGLRLQDPEVKSALTGDDWNDAHAIKDYYSKKLMWNSLKDDSVSDFRSNLTAFLNQQKSSLTKREVGMVVALPHFYEEDMILDGIVREYQTTDCPRVTPNLQKLKREVQFVNQTYRWIQRKKNVFYWFADDNKFVYNIQLEENNVLRRFFEDVVLDRPVVRFETHISLVEHPFSYYKMFDFRLLRG